MFGYSLVNVVDFIINKLILIPVILFSLSCHEIAHGFAAYKFGDLTAKRDGRLSINPLRHIDPIGFIMMIIARFGWAKPVIVNPQYLKDPKKDMAVISSAGPLANITLGFVIVLIYYPLNALLKIDISLPYFAYLPFSELVTIGLPAWELIIYMLIAEMLYLNLSLAIFNLLPIPPLDGSKIFGSFLPNRIYFAFMRLERYGFIILIILIYTGSISGILGALIDSTSKALLFVARHIYFFIH